MEAVRISETSVDNYFTRQYIPEDNSELPNKFNENPFTGSKVVACDRRTDRRGKANTHIFAATLRKRPYISRRPNR
jgi:hypothetical protein